MSGTVRVAIVDDHALVRDGLAALVAAEADLEVAGVAPDTAGAIELIDQARPDVVVCDVQLADQSGFSLLERYAGGSPAFVMCSAHDHPTYHRTAFERGAAAFVLKSADSAEFLEAIRMAASGRSGFSPSTILAVQTRSALPTPRELQVIAQLADGRTTEEVAAALGIRPRTVESHLRSMSTRFGALSRTELVIRAVREGWVRPRTSRPAVERSRGPAHEGWVVDEGMLRIGRQPGAAPGPHRSQR